MKGGLIAALFIAMTIGLGWAFGPALTKDFQVRGGELVAAENARITAAECRSKVFVVTWCRIRYTEAGSSATLRYLMFGQLGDARVELLRLKSGGPVVTSNIGLAYWTNRLISFAVAMLLLIGLAFGGLRMVRTGG